MSMGVSSACMIDVLDNAQTYTIMALVYKYVSVQS